MPRFFAISSAVSLVRQFGLSHKNPPLLPVRSQNSDVQAHCAREVERNGNRLPNIRKMSDARLRLAAVSSRFPTRQVSCPFSIRCPLRGCQ
jgi:hypothetical protein